MREEGHPRGGTAASLHRVPATLGIARRMGVHRVDFFKARAPHQASHPMV